MHENIKKTLVIGASDNPERYANKAIRLLTTKGHPVIAIGNRESRVNDVHITKSHLQYDDIHTVTLYINPKIQREYYDYIISLKPIRIIFNPGTENQEFYNIAKDNGIIPEEACTLVLLNLNQY